MFWSSKPKSAAASCCSKSKRLRCVQPLITRAALALPLAIASGAAMAELLPLWEAGIGLAVIDFPDYAGADQRTTYPLPLPYFVYRGEKLKVGREGIRALFFDSDRVELDFSANAAAPVKSTENRARQGMPDLDPTFQIGPTLNFTLHKREQSKLQVRLPVRAVVATDFTHAQGAGFVFEPELVLDLNKLSFASGWHFGIGVGPMFADRRYNAYYYTVQPQFATRERPAYEAKAGYGGMQVLLSTSRRYHDWWVGAFVRYQSLDGAVFRDSPLVKQRYAVAGGIGFAYVFARSGKLVESDD
jgi:outer membrane scaffolding protein for murein synthesis (MipA/OmpV family)